MTTAGSKPFRAERSTDILAWRWQPIPPPFPPAVRGRVALCRQGCWPEKPWPTTLWRAFQGRGSAKAKPNGWPAASLDPAATGRTPSLQPSDATVAFHTKRRGTQQGVHPGAKHFMSLYLLPTCQVSVSQLNFAELH